MNIGIIVFPGSHCDRDVRWATEGCLGVPTSFLWHETTDLDGFDAIVIPGGFSYGDYLRCGAIARFAPVLESLIDFVNRGGRVLGICNGFQILTECGLLPGALLRNSGIAFVCRDVFLNIEQNNNPFMQKYSPGQVVRFPVAHHDGNYCADTQTLDELDDSGRVAFRYCGPGGEIEKTYNPNGSARNIAGILNPERNVLGMMPHPERHSLKVLGNTDGLGVFESLLLAVSERKLAAKPIHEGKMVGTQ